MIRSTGRLSAAVLVAVALAACSSGGTKTNGEAKKTSAQVLADTKAALKAATSVRVSGPVAGKGATATVLDMRYVNGRGAVGTLTEKGQPLHLIRIGDVLYLQGGAAYFGAQAAKVIGNRYVKIPINQAGDTLDQATDLAKVADGLTPTGKLATTVGTGSVNGAKSVVLTDSGDGSTIDVAATGPARPLRLVDTGKGTDATQGTVTFTDYGATVPLTAPANPLTLPAGTAGSTGTATQPT